MASIDRNKLSNILQEKYNIENTFEPEIYSAINIFLYYDYSNFSLTQLENGEVFKPNNNIQNRTHTINIFKHSSIIILRSVYNLHNINPLTNVHYNIIINYFTKLIADERENIRL